MVLQGDQLRHNSKNPIRNYRDINQDNDNGKKDMYSWNLSIVLLTTEITISWFVRSHDMTLTPDIMGSNWIEYLKNYIFTMQLPTSVI